MSEKPTVLIATGIFPPDIGGPATYSKILLDELPKRRVLVRVLSFGSVRRWPKIIKHLVYFFKTLYIARDVNIVFAQDPVSVGLPSLIAAKILGKKFVLKIVGDYAWEQGMQRFGVNDLLDKFLDQKYCWQVEFLRKVQKFVANRASKIIVPSQYLKSVVLRWGVNEKKIFVIYNSFDETEFAISRKEAREKVNLEGPALISAGRLVPWKGFEALIEIMPEISEQIPGVKLIIIGDGPDRKKLEEKISDARQGHNIFLTGQISHNDSLTLLKAGDIFILNTAYEGLSHLILEAMQAELPIITTPVGGNKELIKDGENGVLIQYNDKEEIKKAIVDLWYLADVRNRLAQQAKKDIKRFAIENMIDQITEILFI